MSASHPRPKRGGEDYVRTHLQQDDEGGPSSKKARFDLRNPSALAPDALEEDAILDADEIGRRGQQVRRNAVNLDGIESDSENEGFDAQRQFRAKKDKKNEADDDDDMFAELEEDFGGEENDGDESSRKDKKSVRFLRDDEIEGQVNSSRGGVNFDGDISKEGKTAVEEDESASEVDDEERAKVDEELDEEIGAGGKKKHAPLLDGFNMRNEQEEGKFDEAGNYIRKAADPDAIHDSWMEGVSKKDMKKAKEAAERREAERKEKDKMDDGVLTADALGNIITHLERGETILEALARLGKGLKKKPKWQNKQRNKKSKQNGNGEDTEMTEDNPEEVARKQAIDAVTGAADILMTRGQAEIYDTEREMLTRQYCRETGEDWIDPPSQSADAGPDSSKQAPTMWEFRWADARDGGDAHGPYDGSMMESWVNAGYFGEGVEFRRVGDSGEWSRQANFV